MAAPRKAILSCGLGRFAANDPNAQAHFGPDAGAKTHELLQSSIAKASQAGFDIVMIDANPADPDDTLQRLTKAMRDQDIAGVNIGYGLRGHKGMVLECTLDMHLTDRDVATDRTELFEKIVNLCWELRPGVKILFSNGPQEVYTAIERNFDIQSS